MNELWWCPTCKRPVELDVHGRCSHCGSDAVVTMAANYQRTTKHENDMTTAARKFLDLLRTIEKHREEDSAILELERMWDLK